MFGYTPAQIVIGLLALAIVGVLAWYHLSFRWSVWKGRKITQQRFADETEKLKREMEEIRPEFPNFSDRELEKIVQGRRLRAIVDGMEKRHAKREVVSTSQVNPNQTTQQHADGGVGRPVTVHTVKNDRPKFTDVHRSPLEDVAIAMMLNSHQYDEVLMERPRESDDVVRRFDGGFRSPLTTGADHRPHTAKETPQENEVKGKGNDTTTGNDSGTRASGHRSDRDDSSGTKEGWGSDRLQGGTGWGGGAFGSRDSRDDSDDRRDNDSSGNDSSPSND